MHSCPCTILPCFFIISHLQMGEHGDDDGFWVGKGIDKRNNNVRGCQFGIEKKNI